MQIEIKGHGLAALWRDMLADSDVTSTVAAGAAALAISYVIWKAGQGINRLRHRLRAKLDTSSALRVSAGVVKAASKAPEPARTAHDQWQRLDRTIASRIHTAGKADAAHARAGLIVGALECEIDDLIGELARANVMARGAGGAVPTRFVAARDRRPSIAA